jgi:hypothetical protein
MFPLHKIVSLQDTLYKKHFFSFFYGSVLESFEV